MKVPLRWLADFVDTGLPPKELAHRLTMAGLEAEGIEEIGSGWANVVVGHVARIERHPDADRLVLAEVEAGAHRLTVVTGAPNIAAGQNVALALAGARLFDGHSDTPQLKTLKPGTIRGVRSEGMVCSAKELGLSDEHEGIMTLEPEAPVGAQLADWLGDTVIEFEITPNLVHAFSVLGIAREAAALTDSELRLPPIASLSLPVGPQLLVQVEAPDLCPRCSATVIEGVTVAPSPPWLVRRLGAAGLRPINNLVDITNYVMLEWGQPLHAYDRDRLSGGGIVVRRAAPGETIETLDHQRRPLPPDTLVIADADRAVGIAGVMGGVDSEVDAGTTSILLEAAVFDMRAIRQTARALKLRTDASARFERGLDPASTLDAAARATQLILDLCPGSRVVEVADVYPAPVLPRPITMPFGDIERLLGVRYDAATVRDALDRLGFAPAVTEEEIAVTVPTYRHDVTMAADLVEEVARVVGYDTLPETLPRGRAVPVQRDPMYAMQRAARAALVAAGASEAVTHVAITTAMAERLAPAPPGQVEPSPTAFPSEMATRLARTVGSGGYLLTAPAGDLLRLRNPIQSERGVLRPTLLPSLLEVAAANLKHERGVRLFELARGYLPIAGETLPREANLAAIVMAGQREPLGRFNAPGEIDFFDAKGAVDAVLHCLGVVAVDYATLDHAALHPGRAASVLVGNVAIGFVGEVRPDRTADYGIDVNRVAVAELDFDAVFALRPDRVEGVAVPRFLPVEQDFAIVVADDTPAADVERELLVGAGPLATASVLFDEYRGEQIGAGKKSLAFRVTFTAPDRALTDADVAKARGRIEKVLAQRVGGELRA